MDNQGKILADAMWAARVEAKAAYKEWKAHSALAEHIKAVYLKEYTDAWQAYQQADMAQFLYEAENE